MRPLFLLRRKEQGGGEWPPALRLIALALLVAGTGLGFWLAFPDDALRERIEHEVARRAPVELTLSSLSLSFPPALRGGDAVLHLEHPRRRALTLDAVTVRPLWLSLFDGNPGLAFRAEADEGYVAGTVHRDGLVAAEGNQLPFSLHLGTWGGVEVTGLLGDGRLAGGGGSESLLELRLEDVRINGLEAVGIGSGALSLGRVTVQGASRGKTFRLEQLAAEGGSLLVSGGGTLTLAEPLERSRISLALTLVPGEDFDAGLNDLLALFAKPGRDGSYRLRIAGTLALPRLQ